MLLERWDAKLAVTGVALVIAVGEPRRKLSQVALLDWLAAQRTERLRAGCPAIHQDEFHMSPPHSVSYARTRVASRQQRTLQMRSLQRKFIGQAPRLEDPDTPSPREALSLNIGLRSVFRYSRERLGWPRSAA
jgi:hypothetical protein